MAINYSKINWDTNKFVNPSNMNQMDDGIKAACDGVDAVNESMNKFVNVRLNTTGGFSTMADDIAEKWSSVPKGIGAIRFSNGDAIFHGTYCKISDSAGSITLHQAGKHTIYTWEISTSDGHSLDAVALNSDLTSLYELGFVKKYTLSVSNGSVPIVRYNGTQITKENMGGEDRYVVEAFPIGTGNLAYCKAIVSSSRCAIVEESSSVGLGSSSNNPKIVYNDSGVLCLSTESTLTQTYSYKVKVSRF